jgi:hypothetical protein
MAIVVALFIIITTSILAYYIVDEFWDQPIAQQIIADNSDVDGVSDVPDNFRSGLAIMDNIVVILMVVMMIGLVIINTKVATSKVFMFISFIMAPFLGASSYFMSFIFSQWITATPELFGVAVYFSKSILIATNFHWVAIVSFLIASISMYAKKDEVQDVTFQGGL